MKPKEEFVAQTRELINLTKESGITKLGDLIIHTDPAVFNPEVFFSSQWFAEQVAGLVKNEQVFIEVGCGTGIVSIQTALSNPSLQVYSTDIIPQAAEITKINAQENGVENQVTTFAGDVLDSIPQGVKANSIFWSLPFGYLEPDTKLTNNDQQTFDPGYRAIRKFFETASNHLKEDGRLLIGFSKDIGHLDLLTAIGEENNYSLNLIRQTIGVEKDSVSMEIYEARLTS